ncbi:SPX domain-containing membrane protein [Abeliophyllum distichum]|uniref:SPX domain-containing membrane protein n=1 Tax=Abeliophyllum distichum TaxID=126358 RepID=A0ABD1TVP8_9LAMI
MKKKLKQYDNQFEAGALDQQRVLKDFSRLLDNQIEKIVLFILKQQGLLASRIAQVNEQPDFLEERPDKLKIFEFRLAYGTVGFDLLKLLHFVEMNAIGLRKILKKFDKRFGYKFTDYYVKTSANHPYSQLQQVFKQVGLGAVVGAISHNLADLHNRQGNYSSIYDQPTLPLQASAGFVSASALGMACGPALAGLLQTKFRIYKITFNQDTSPGWVMALAWLIYLIWLWISFREPALEAEVNNVPQESNTVENDKLETSLAQPLLLMLAENEQECDGSEEALEESRQPENSLASAYELLTPSIKVFAYMFVNTSLLPMAWSLNYLIHGPGCLLEIEEGKKLGMI